MKNEITKSEESLAQEESVEQVDNKAIIKALVEQGLAVDVLRDIDKFDGLDEAAVIETLIELGEGEVVINGLDSLTMSHDEVAESFIRLKQEKFVAAFLSKFENLDSDFGEVLLDKGYVDAVISHLRTFVLNRDFAMKVIDASFESGNISALIAHKDKFKWLDGNDKNRINKRIEEFNG